MHTHLPRYSTLLSTIYDEPEPVGKIGRGAHYSVLRCAEWFDVTRAPLAHAQIHDFAVIWDEDHDTRVIQVIEQLYIEGLLSPIQFIGERKGTLTVIVASSFYYSAYNVIQDYILRIENIADTLEFDSWGAEVGVFNKNPDSPRNTTSKYIIQDSDDRVQTYLKNIDSLWNLGTKLFVPEALLQTDE